MYIVRFEDEAQVNITGKLVEVFKDGKLEDYCNSDKTEEESLTEVINSMANRGLKLERIIRE